MQEYCKKETGWRQTDRDQRLNFRRENGLGNVRLSSQTLEGNSSCRLFLAVCWRIAFAHLADVVRIRHALHTLYLGCLPPSPPPSPSNRSRCVHLEH